VVLLKYDPAGNLVYSRHYGTAMATDERAQSIASDDNGIYMAGDTDGDFAGPNAGADDIFVLKCDFAGNPVWMTQYGGLRFDNCFGISVDAGGRSFVAGGTSGDPFVTKLSPTGVRLWTRQIATEEIDSIGAPGALATDGAAYFVGHTEGDLGAPNAGGADAFLVKVAPEAPCYADCDTSTGPGVLDVFDFRCFQDAFVAGDPYADCDGNTVLDVFDFLCFQDAFVAGCP
jgi:hypothetical protein